MHLQAVVPVQARPYFEAELSRILDRSITIATDPNPDLVRKLIGHTFEVLYVPGIREDQFPTKIARPNRRRYVEKDLVETLPLTPGWVSVETISLHDIYSAVFPRAVRGDFLPADISLSSRFDHNFRGPVHGHKAVMDDLLPAIAKFLNKKFGLTLKPEQIMLPSLEERHFLALWLNDQRQTHNLPFPDLNYGSKMWEWCRNMYDHECRIITSGCEENDTMMAVSSAGEDVADINTGFRILIRHEVPLS